MKYLNELQGPKPDQYFSQRVLAQALSRKNKRHVLFWKSLALFSSVCAILLAVFVFRIQNISPFMQAPAGQAMLLQLDKLPQDARIAYVAMEIDHDMKFAVEDPQLANEKELTLPIESLKSAQHRLPFVFQAQAVGKKRIRIKFLDQDYKLVVLDDQYFEFYNNNKESI